MLIYNTTKKEIVLLEINDPKTNTNMASDIVGNSWHDLDWIEIDGEKILSGDNEKCEWWEKYCDELDNAESDIEEFLNDVENSPGHEYHLNIREEYHNFIGGVEFNDKPSAINKFIENYRDC